MDVGYDLKEEIDAYIATSVTDELAAEMQLSFMIFDAFEYAKAYEPFPDILMGFDGADVAYDYDQRLAVFTEAIISGLKYILEQHQVELNDYSLEHCNLFAEALFRIQHYHDPVVLARSFEGTLTKEQSFCRVLSIAGGHDELRYFEVLQGVAESTVETLKEFLAKREERLEEESRKNEHSKAFSDEVKKFFSLLGNNNLAYNMINSGIAIGYPLETYLPFVDHHIVTEDNESTALNLLSLFMISVDCHYEPIEAFRKHSEALLPIERLREIETIFGNKVNHFKNYLKAHDEQTRLSSV